VDNAKQSLMKESEDGVRLETEKKDLEFRLNQVHENHKVNVQLYKEDIADTREKLLRERKIRQTADEKYNELQTKIHDQLSKQMKVVHTLTASLEKFEQEDKILSDKEKELQENIDRHKSNISTLTKEFDGLQKHLNQRQVQLDEQLTSLEDSIAVLQEEIIDSTEQLTVLEPQSITLEEEYNDITAQYDEAKKNMIDLKNYKISLMETCQRTTKELEKMHIPQEKLRMDTLICRAYARKHLQEQQKYMEDIEKKVNDRESKLKAVLVENEKFEKAISYLESECARFNMYCDTSTDRECSYEAKLHDRHKFLQDKQKENEDNEKFYAMKDKELLASLANLQIDGTEQIHKLSSLSRQFDEEMKQFNSFLKRLAKPTTQHPTS
jgi:chromosome segregation ATPase